MKGEVAYWAHLGGLFTGVVTGLMCLRFGWIKLSSCDGASLYELLTNRDLERLQEEVDNSE